MAEGAAAPGSSYEAAYQVVLGDLRKLLNTVIREERQRDGPYLSAVAESTFAPVQMSTRDFGFFGERNPLGRKQMTSARRFFGPLDLLLSILRDGMEDRSLRESNPALWAEIVRTYRQARTYTTAGLVELHSAGASERSYAPLVLRSDFYDELTGMAASKEAQLEEARRLAAMGREAGSQQQAKAGVWGRLTKTLGKKAGPAWAPYQPQT